MKQIIYLFLFTFSFTSCNENGTTNTEEEVATADVEINTPTDKAAENKAKIDALKKQIIAEDDYEGRMKKGLATIQQEYDESMGLVPDLGKVTIDLDDKLGLTIKNELDGDVHETKVNLLDLDKEQGGFRLIPDKEPSEFPGLRIKTINEKPLVMIYKNGELVNKNNELVIFLKDRESIESITAPFLQTLRVAKEMKK